MEKKIIVFVCLVGLISLLGCTYVNVLLPPKFCGEDISCLNESLKDCTKTHFETTVYSSLGNYNEEISIFGGDSNLCVVHLKNESIPSGKIYEEKTCLFQKGNTFSSMNWKECKEDDSKTVPALTK